jgi:eukaryotic-like serine/threonine-protein kinase
MPTTPGSRIGHYEVVAPLGAGGMGEVFRARDTRLGRDVAIKALPEAFAQDPERLARFEREARLLASLSHPNIAGIFGLEEVAGARYLVLEFVEGETLAARLARGPLPLDDALDVARQVAAGVEAAHESGVVHRDLKPGNVMLTPAAGVKVLDFGLARSGAGEKSSSDPNLSASPTRTHAATQAGVILGTAAYMSPEQARGRAVDRRTDVWSFGCVLFECLTGRPLFEGDTVSDLIAKILQTEPAWAALPAETPPRVRKLLERALRKDASMRLRDMGDVRIELSEILAGGAEEPAPAAPARGVNGSWRAAAVAALVLAAALAGLLVLRRPAAAPVTRLEIASPDPDTDITERGNYAISPDGRALAFAMPDSAGIRHLHVRPIDSPESRVLEGTEGAMWPFWSPDGRDLGYFTANKLRRIPAQGGPTQDLADVNQPRGGAWGRTGVILFAPQPKGPLFRVDATGGPVRAVTKVDSTGDSFSHRFPRFLPDGRHFFSASQRTGLDGRNVAFLASLDDPTPHFLGIEGEGPTFVAPDWVVFGRAQNLMAQRIDLGTLAPKGPPVPLAERVQRTFSISESPVASGSDNGLLVYAPDYAQLQHLSWIYPDGRSVLVRDRLPRVADGMALTDDGQRVAMVFDTRYGQMVVLDTETGKVTEIASGDRVLVSPIWNPAGTRLLGLRRQQGWPLVISDPSGGPDSVFFAGDGLWRLPLSWSEKAVVVFELTNTRGRDLSWFPFDGPRELRDYRATPKEESDAALSHDGRWLAYWSDENGRADLYVDRFPESTVPRRVTMGVDMGPMAIGTVLWAWWGAGDRELFFLAADRTTVYACDVALAPALVVGPPREFLRLPKGTSAMTYDAAHGRFLVMTPTGAGAQPLAITTNWTRQLEERH